MILHSDWLTQLILTSDWSGLEKYLSKSELGLGRSEKLSYAAVTLGQGQSSGTMTSPLVQSSVQSITSNPGYLNTVPLLSPASQSQQADYRALSHPPYNRVFSGSGGLFLFNFLV